MRLCVALARMFAIAGEPRRYYGWRGSRIAVVLAMLGVLASPARAGTCPDSSYPYLGSLSPPHYAAGVRARHTTTLLGGGIQSFDDCDTDSALLSWADSGASGIDGSASGNTLASLSQGKLHASDQGRANNLFDYSHAKAILADRLTVTWDGTGTPPTPVPNSPGFFYVPVTFTMHVYSVLGIQVDAGLTTAQLMNQRLTVASHAILGFLDESKLISTFPAGANADFTRHVEYDFSGTMLTDEVTAQNYGDTGSTFDGNPLAKGATTTLSTVGYQNPGFPADIVYVQMP